MYCRRERCARRSDEAYRRPIISRLGCNTGCKLTRLNGRFSYWSEPSRILPVVHFAFWMHCWKVLVFIRCVLNYNDYSLLLTYLKYYYWLCRRLAVLFWILVIILGKYSPRKATLQCAVAALLWCNLLSQQYHVSLNEFKVEKNKIISMLWGWNWYVLPEQILCMMWHIPRKAYFSCAYGTTPAGK